MSTGKKPSTDDLLKQELEAQKKRAEALAYLRDNGCGPSQFEKNLTPQGFIGTADAIRAGVSRDNTIDQVRKRKKEILNQQQEVREKIIAVAHQARQVSKALPPGWKEVKDPSSGRIYYWNKATGKTQWTRPESMPEPPASNHSVAAQTGNSVVSSSRDEGNTNQQNQSTKAEDGDLPSGWEKKFHPASKQYYYVHKVTQERRWTKPDFKGAQSDIQPTQTTETASSKHEEQQTGKEKKKKKKRNKSRNIDPLDPTGNKKGKWSDGLVNMGERMADSTASGPLWQQRPYPAPGQVLRGLSKPKEPKVSVTMKPHGPPIPR